MLSNLTTSCVAVLELLLMEKDVATGATLHQYGSGWCILDINTDLRQSKRFFSGSPRALLYLDQSMWDSKLGQIPGCEISYSVTNHEPLLIVQHLLRVNEFIGAEDIVPGLHSSVRQSEKRSGSTEISVPHIGADYEEEDYVSIFPAVPRLAKTVVIELSDLEVRVPIVLEQQLKTDLAHLWEVETNTKLPAQTSGRILEKFYVKQRSLRVGLHNGITLVGSG